MVKVILFILVYFIYICIVCCPYAFIKWIDENKWK